MSGSFNDARHDDAHHTQRPSGRPRIAACARSDPPFELTLEMLPAVRAMGADRYSLPEVANPGQRPVQVEQRWVPGPLVPPMSGC